MGRRPRCGPPRSELIADGILRPQTIALLIDRAEGPTCQRQLNKVFILTQLAAPGFHVNFCVALYKKHINSATACKSELPVLLDATCGEIALYIRAFHSPALRFLP